MKKKLLTFCISLSSVIVLHAQNNDYTMHVPNSVSAIIRVNTAAITEKINLSALIQQVADAAGKKQTADDKAMLEVIKDPSKTGIDLSKELWIMNNKLYAYDSTSYTIVLGSVTDTTMFRKFMRTSMKKAATKYQPHHYLMVDTKNNSVIAWNNTFFVTVKAKEATRITTEQSYEQEVKSKKPLTKLNYSKLATIKAKAVLAGFKYSFLSTDTVFTNSLATDADITIWSKANDNLGMLKNLKKIGIPTPGSNLLAASKQATDKSKTSVTSIRFENGKMGLTSVTYLEEELAGIMKNLMSGNISSSLTKRILPGNVLGWMSINMKLSGLVDMLTAGDMKKELDSTLAKENLTSEELLNAFKGEGMLVLMAPENEVPGEKPKPVAYFAASVQNKSTVEKMLKLMDEAKAKKEAQRKQMEEETVDLSLEEQPVDTTVQLTENVEVTASPDSLGTVTSVTIDEEVSLEEPPPPVKNGPFGNMNMVRVLNEEVLVLAGTQEMADKIAVAHNEMAASFLTADMQQSPFSFYVDIQGIYKMMMKAEEPQTDKDKSVASMVSSFDKLIIYSTHPEKNKLHTKMDLLLTDKTTNSLQLLLELVMKSGMSGAAFK
jgi:hypothetical protein